MAETVKVVFIGQRGLDGKVTLAPGFVIPANYLDFAESVEVSDTVISAGDLVANADYSMVGLVTTTGYVLVRNTANPANVGKHNTYDITKIADAGFKVISLGDFHNRMHSGT